VKREILSSGHNHFGAPFSCQEEHVKGDIHSQWYFEISREPSRSYADLYAKSVFRKETSNNIELREICGEMSLEPFIVVICVGMEFLANHYD